VDLGSPRFRAELREKVGKVKNFIRVALREEAPSPIVLRLMREADLPMLHGWLKRAHVREWWAGEEALLPFEEIRARYLPRVMAGENVTPYIAMLGERPIGYAQSYVAMGSGAGWWEDETDPGVRGIDQFLCEPSDLGQGLGTRMVKALVARLFEDPAVTRIQTDPDPRNLRAIRCYEKAGFRALGTIVTPDGAALYMAQERPGTDAHAQRRSQTSS
jgi:AacA4 family aminoglycoside N(6')-acetyltransferase